MYLLRTTKCGHLATRRKTAGGELIEKGRAFCGARNVPFVAHELHASLGRSQNRWLQTCREDRRILRRAKRTVSGARNEHTSLTAAKPQIASLPIGAAHSVAYEMHFSWLTNCGCFPDRPPTRAFARGQNRPAFRDLRNALFVAHELQASLEHSQSSRWRTYR